MIAAALSVCEQGYSKSCKSIFGKYLGALVLKQKKQRLDFAVNWIQEIFVLGYL